MVDRTKYVPMVYSIIGAAMNVHKELGFGLLESVYQESLSLELNDKGISSVREKEIEIYYKHHMLEKKFKMDLVIGDIIVELKSTESIHPSHRAQLCNYLRLTKKPIGLLINFGAASLQGERWAYDEQTNQCFIVDRHMNPLPDLDYSKYLPQE